VPTTKRDPTKRSAERIPGIINRLRKETRAATKLDFERAAELQDEVRELEAWATGV